MEDVIWVWGETFYEARGFSWYGGIQGSPSSSGLTLTIESMVSVTVREGYIFQQMTL